jgi:hypothetical protein
MEREEGCGAPQPSESPAWSQWCTRPVGYPMTIPDGYPTEGSPVGYPMTTPDAYQDTSVPAFRCHLSSGV